ncbi:MAG TPA: VWA domain-containing protein [Longimicrobiaceae bacterium]|jgi:nitric oxide reductase NorD protein
MSGFRFRPGGRRAAPPGPAAPSTVLRLDDVRRRLEFLLAAVYGRPLPILAAPPPQPLRWFDLRGWRTPRHLRPGAPLAADDGRAIYLPPELDALGAHDAVARYRLLALQHAERISRGTAASVPPDAEGLRRDLYLLAEASTVDREVARIAPGMLPVLAAERTLALGARPPLELLTPAERAVEDIVVGVLGADAAADPGVVPHMATTADSRQWADETAARIAGPAAAYRGTAPVGHWGTVRPPIEAALATGADAIPRIAIHIPHATRGTHASASGQGKAARRLAEGGDGSHAGPARPGEQGKAPEQPPADATAGSDPEADRDGGREEGGEADRDPGARPRTPENPADGAGASAGGPPAGAAQWLLPEWDFRASAYRPGAVAVRIVPPVPGDARWGPETLRAAAPIRRHMRSQFERLRAQRVRTHRQRQGDELDLESCVRAQVERLTEGTSDDRLYAVTRATRRELAIVLLVDVSGSTIEQVGVRKVIESEQLALLLVSQGLDALADPYCVLTFASLGADDVRIQVVKAFHERNDAAVMQRVAGLKPGGYTRLGAAVRYATQVLAERPARHRLLLLISDGKPDDKDGYTGDYGIEDSRQAILETRRMGVVPFCLTIDRRGRSYLNRIFGPTGHMILTEPDRLPAALSRVVRFLIRS